MSLLREQGGSIDLQLVEEKLRQLAGEDGERLAAPRQIAEEAEEADS